MATTRLIALIEKEQKTFIQSTVGTHLIERQSVMPKKKLYKNKKKSHWNN